MGGGKGPEAPPPRDYYKETSDTLRAQVEMAPQLYASEAAYRPMYQRLELAGYRNTLLGRVNPEDLSAQSRAEYDAAMQEYAGADSKLAQLRGERARIAAGQTSFSRTGGALAFGGGNRRGTTVVDTEALAKIDREINRVELISKAKPDAASFSDRGLIDILEQDILPAFARSEAATQSTQRASDIADVERLGRRASEAYLNADPRSKSLLEAVNAQALASVQAGTGLTPQQERYALQVARRGMAERGLGMGNQGLISDVLGTYRLGVERQQMGLQNANATLALNKGFTADPFQAILGRQGQAFGSAIGQQQFASGMASSIGPRLFSTESQYMADLQGSNQQTAAAYAAAGAQVKAGMMQGLSSLVGSGLGAYGALKQNGQIG